MADYDVKSDLTDLTDEQLHAEHAITNETLTYHKEQVGHVSAQLHELTVKLAPADEKLRLSWLERLYQDHEDDGIPYIESLAEFWGDLCATPEIASHCADDRGIQ